MIEEPSISLVPRWYQRFWAIIDGILRFVFQIAVLAAALTFPQRQEPLLQRSIDHTTKILQISPAGFSPTAIRVYAIRFHLALDDEAKAKGHFALNARKPISQLYTQGLIFDGTVWFPWSSITLDLKSNPSLTFDEWGINTSLGEFATIYCFAIEARNRLSNQTTIEAILTSKVKFSASIFGPMSAARSSLGGGYPTDLISVESLMKTDCRGLYEKFR